MRDSIRTRQAFKGRVAESFAEMSDRASRAMRRATALSRAAADQRRLTLRRQRMRAVPYQGG